MNVFLKPLIRLQTEKDKTYHQELRDYQQELAKWEKAKKSDKGERPTEPIPIEYILQDVTTESLIQTINDQPNKALIRHFDELSSLLAEANRYRSGGNDIEIMLSGRDGSAVKVKRKNGTRYTCERASWTVLGGITKDILREQMKDHQDSRGHWARFIYAVLPRTKQQFPDDDIKIDLSEMLYSA